jgi:hypothetical protein
MWLRRAFDGLVWVLEQMERGSTPKQLVKAHRRYSEEARTAVANLQTLLAQLATEVQAYDALLSRYVREYDAGRATPEMVARYATLQIEKHAQHIPRLKREIMHALRKL